MRHDGIAAAPLPENAGREISPARIAGEPLEAERPVVSSLPRDHPAWQRDVLAVSARAREIVARSVFVLVRVLSFWDHVRRAVPIAGRMLEIDPSGSYRLR
jgi:hypothetical protein